MLSRFTKKIHAALSSEHKEDLTTAFETIKDSFEETEEFSSFFDTFSKALSDSVKGFVHSLAVDFSAYDPNNYAKSLRIYAKEGDDVRSGDTILILEAMKMEIPVVTPVDGRVASITVAEGEATTAGQTVAFVE